MFEKEAEEYFETECLHSYADTEEQLKEDVVPAFQKGAEFGYNKAKEEDKEKIQKLKAFIEELCFSLNNSSTDPCEDLLIYNAEQFIKEN